MNPETKTKIEKLINENKTILFMKGTPQYPECGFSMQVVQVLNEQKIPFTSFNILTDEELRQNLKTYANWPTYPQLWVNQKLIGGCDIVTQLAHSGELKKVVN
tara:strand:- start:97 stop:405 length:309 start_codon:yes stop_codon:yes gene_type:complete